MINSSQDALIGSLLLALVVGILVGVWQSNIFAGCSVAIFMTFLDHISYQYSRSR